MNEKTALFLRSAKWRIDHTQAAEDRSFIGRPVKTGDDIAYDWMGPFPKDVAVWLFDAITRKQEQDR